jgi:O-antigen ligase
VKSRALDATVRVFKYFSIYLLIIAYVDTEKKLKIFIYTYISMIIIIFVQPFFLSLNGDGFIYNNGMLRLAGVTSLFGHPNALGITTSSNLPFIYFLSKQDKPLYIRILSLIFLIIAIKVIMLTQSRTAFIGIIMFFTTIFLHSKKRFIFIIVFLVSIPILMNYTPDETKERFLTLTKIVELYEDFSSNDISIRREYGSMGSRYVLMKRAIIVFNENPVIGVGLDCFASVSGRKWGEWFPPHNTYLQILAEQGLVGFTIFILILYYTLYNLKKASILTNTHYSVNKSFLNIIYSVRYSTIIFATVSFFGIEIYNNLWWIFGGLSVVILRIATQKYEQTASKVIVT